MTKVIHAHSIEREKQDHIPIIHSVLSMMFEMNSILSKDISNPTGDENIESIRKWYAELLILDPIKCLKGEIKHAEKKRIQAPRRKSVKGKKVKTEKKKKG